MASRNIDGALLRETHGTFRGPRGTLGRRSAVEGGDGIVVVEDFRIGICEIPVEDADEVSLDFVQGLLVKVGGGDPYHILTQAVRGILRGTPSGYTVLKDVWGTDL
jgi:hypothetical protein